MDDASIIDARVVGIVVEPFFFFERGGFSDARTRKRDHRRRSRSGSDRRRDRRDGHHKKRASPEPPKCDKDGHIQVKLGDDLTDRYKLLDEIGEGTFGKVFECWDRKRSTRVAIKVVRNVERYREGAEVEIDILRKMDDHAARTRWDTCCIRLLNSFEYFGHVCMCFGLYGQSLYDFSKKNHHKGFPIDGVREMAFQLFATIAWMHDFELIHTDLKPENVLLRYKGEETQQDGLLVPNSFDVVLIDFGSATFEDDYHTTIVSTRHYRAPEVILGCGWSYECDVWSLGCILPELLTGDALFLTHENLEHLAMMERVIGEIPADLVRSAGRGQKYFNMDRLLWPVNASSTESLNVVAAKESLATTLRAHPDFLDLVQKCLTYHKTERPTARECLRHPFFEPVIASKKYERLLPPNMRSNQPRGDDEEDDLLLLGASQ